MEKNSELTEAEKNNEKATGHNKPDYIGALQVAGWKKTNKDGKEVITIKLGQYADLYPNER